MRTKLPLDIYVRTSARSGRDDDRLQTLDQQVADCQEFATREGLPLTGVVLEDKFRSGSRRAKRKGLATALERIKSGESGGIVVAYLSRATREGGTGLALFEEIDRTGGAIYGPNVPADWKSADGRLVLGLQLIIDAHIVDKAREHTDKAKARSIARGVPVASPPAGYRRAPDRRYEADPETASVIQQAFAMRASGLGLTAVTDFLNASGVPTSRGNAWGLQTVRVLLTSRTYLGEARSGEHVNPNAHEPLVEASTWHAAQSAVRRKPRRDAQRFYLLAGLVRCAACGYAMGGSVQSRDRSDHAQYRCPRRHAAGVCPNPAKANADRLEAEVVRAYLEEGVTLALPLGGPENDVQRLSESMERAKRRLDQVMGEDARDALGPLWAADVKARRTEYEEAAALLGKAKAATGAASGRTVDLKKAWSNETERLAADETVDLLSAELKRSLLAERFPVIAVEQTGRGAWTWFEAEGKPGTGSGLKTLRPRGLHEEAVS